MRRLITNPKWRWCTSLVVVILITITAFFFSNAWARPSRIASPPQRGTSPKGSITPLAPLYVTGNMTFASPVEMIRPLSPVFFQQGG